MIGRRIKQAREEKGIPRTLFAHLVGVTESNVTNWEAGRYDPKIRHLRKISRLTGKTLEWFLQDEAEEESPPPSSPQSLEYWENWKLAANA